jgi:hypothetical protein
MTGREITCQTAFHGGTHISLVLNLPSLVEVSRPLSASERTMADGCAQALFEPEIGADLVRVRLVS